MPSEIQAMMDCKKRKPTFGKNKKEREEVTDIARQSSTRRLQYVPVR
jgi:hypothetical protein